MKRRMVFKMNGKSLSIKIDCTHGELSASNFQDEDEIVSIKYMVDELRKDKNVSKAFDIILEDPEGSSGLD